MNTTLRIAVICLPALTLASCSVELSHPDPVGIALTLNFSRAHTSVTATWTGTWRRSEYASSLFPSAQTSASGFDGSIGDVVPPRVSDFDAVNNLRPGIWDITIEILEGSGSTPLRIQCTGLDIGETALVAGNVYQVRWNEGSESCESGKELPDLQPTQRDVEVISLLPVPAAGTLGDVITVTADIRNHGDLDEFVPVELRVSPPSGGAGTVIGTLTPLIAPNSSQQVPFTWNTKCVGSPGSYLLEATASAPHDTTGNNTGAAVVQLAADREISIRDFIGPATARAGQLGGTAFSATLANAASQAESAISVSFSDTPAPAGTVQFLLTQLPLSLACGESRQLVMSYFPSSLAPANSVHTLTLTLAPAQSIPGDDPADNSVSTTVTIQP